MAKKESYNDLIFQLGDLARDRLVNKPTCPRSMDRVLKAEEAVIARREELAQLEQQMNDEDSAYQDFVAGCEGEREQNNVLVKKYRRAVDAIEGRVKELRKKLVTKRADHRYEALGLKKEEAKLADLEMTSHDPQKVELAKQNLKKLRLGHMRAGREIEEMERDLELVFAVSPGQPGADGILAHKRILELDDSLEARKAEYDAAMGELDQAIQTKEEELKAAEDYLDQALFLLGEDVYASRINDPALAPFYPRLDVAQ